MARQELLVARYIIKVLPKISEMVLPTNLIENAEEQTPEERLAFSQAVIECLLSSVIAIKAATLTRKISSKDATKISFEIQEILAKKISKYDEMTEEEWEKFSNGDTSDEKLHEIEKAIEDRLAGKDVSNAVKKLLKGDNVENIVNLPPEEAKLVILKLYKEGKVDLADSLLDKLKGVKHESN